MYTMLGCKITLYNRAYQLSRK